LIESAEAADASCRLIKGFATSSEIGALTRLIESHSSLFRETSGKARLGPRYRIIQGEQIRTGLPDILDFGARRVRPAVEQLAGHELVESGLLGATRVQAFDHPDHDFRWHFDTHPYTGLLTLWNHNSSETHVISPGLSRALRFALYPLYPFPGIFDVLPYRRYTMAAGDLLVMRGSQVLHRGVALANTGGRVIVVYSFITPGQKLNPLRLLIAGLLNYSKRRADNARDDATRFTR